VLAGIIKQLKIAVILLGLMTLLTGVIYPLVVTVLAQWLFPWQANGSLLSENGKEVGSLLIGQSFTDNNYFWGRVSATQPYSYNAENSTGSNLGPSNPDYLAMVKSRVLALKQADPDNQHPVPVDLVTASGSGLDPDISPLAAYYQVPRVAKARQLSEDRISMLVNEVIEKRTLGVLGEARVNVLKLNRALDKLVPTRSP
jgi:potassium-transporting ATPase KdpC subunit